MSLARAIRSAIMRREADPARREAQRRRAEAARQRAGAPHVVRYFHQLDDPWSQLAVQALPALLDRYDIRLEVHLVAAATPIAIHEPALWDRWASGDAAAIAPFHGLDYTPPRAAPDAALLAQARAIAAGVREPRAFAALARELGAAVNAGDRTALEAIAGRQPPAPADVVEALLDANFRLRHRLGHYLGGMFHYAGEWYWGIDRLAYLEQRLDGLGARRGDAPPGPSVLRRRSVARPAGGERRLRLEFFPSLRSPYTHLSYDRVAALAARYPVDLVLRPVLPMMMRGVKADRRKGFYILKDTQREAQRLGIPFGNLWDPFGPPVLRAYSLFPWARDAGRGFEYLRSYSLAVWSERTDAWSEAGLRRIVERAGLRWADARARLDNRDWEGEFESNVDAMIAAGSWGVPTLRLLADRQGEQDFTVWGQDRIWLIEEAIIARLGLASGHHRLTTPLE